MKQREYIFYRGNYKSLKAENSEPEKDYQLDIWTPKIWQIAPKNLFFKSFIAWWAFHYFRIFKNREYKIFIIYFKGKEMAHYSLVLPKYFRTPFMGDDDLQIGPVGTIKKHQRKGLATFVITKILEFYKDKDINFWYISRKENEPSRRLIEKIGFTKYGEGLRVKRFGFHFFGSFVVKN